MSRLLEAIATAPLAVINALEFLGRNRGDDDLTPEWRARWRAFACSSVAVLLAFAVVMFASPSLSILSSGVAPVLEVLAWLLTTPVMVAMVSLRDRRP